MSRIIEIKDLSAAELMPYTNMSEQNLLSWKGTEYGIFIAESPKVIRTALENGFEPLSFLTERKYINGQASDIFACCGDIPVYTADSTLLEELTGFRLTQGLLSVMKRTVLPDAAALLSSCRRIAVLEDIMNQNNVGAIFRSAAALGIDAVLLSRRCSDPFFRRCVRVSMGTVFQVPWTYLPDPDYIAFLKANGFSCAAMALRNDTIDIRDNRLSDIDKLAIVLGTEGEGLKADTIESCDYTIKIPMSKGVDSLNVAAASAVAFWQLCQN